MLRQHEHKLLSTRTNTNNNRCKQEHSQTNTDTEDRRQGHHNSLEPTRRLLRRSLRLPRRKWRTGLEVRNFLGADMNLPESHRQRSENL